MDNLQWVQPSTVKILNQMIKKSNNKYLMIILSYRGLLSNKIVNTKEDMLIKEIVKEEKVRKVMLRPFGFEEISMLLADALNSDIERVKELSEEVLDKTYGNPLFVKQLMKALYDRKLIYFDYQDIEWQWNTQKIKSEKIPNNVVDMIVEEIMILPEDTKRLIGLAACLSNSFDIETLSLISEVSKDDVIRSLNPAIEAGLLKKVGKDKNFISDMDVSEMKFAHDCIQQSAYSMIWKDNTMELHLMVGRLLLKNSDEDTYRYKIFDIVNHLNYAGSLIEDQHERRVLATLNFTAGVKARNTSDFEIALSYFLSGFNTLTERKWEDNYHLCSAFVLEIAECYQLLGCIDETEEIIQDFFLRAKTDIEKLQAYIILVKLNTGNGFHKKAIKIAKEGIRFAGIEFEENITKKGVLEYAISIKSSLPHNVEEYCLRYKRLTDKDKICAMKLIVMLSESAYYVDRNLWKYSMVRIVEFSLKYGNSSASAVGYAGFGKIIAQSHDVREGYRLGILSLNMANETEDIYIRSRVYYIFGYYICHLKENYNIGLSYLKKSIDFSASLGNVNYQVLVFIAIVTIKIAKGSKLKDIRQDMSEFSNVIDRCKEPVLHYYLHILKFNIEAYGCTNRESLQNIYDKVLELEQKVLEYEFDSMLALYYSVKVKILFYLDDLEEAVKIIFNKVALTEVLYGDINQGSLLYVSAICVGSYYNMHRNKFHGEHVNFIKTFSNILENLCRFCDQNIMHKFLLVNAELSRIEGRNWEAQILYEKVIEKCISEDFLLDAAITAELAARFYSSQGLETSAVAYVTKAKAIYSDIDISWNIIRINKDFSKLLSKNSYEYNQYTQETKESLHESLSNINVNTAIKVSKIISEEIIMDKLLIKLINIAIESSGAQKGYLILYKGDKFKIEAEGSIYENSESKAKKISHENYEGVAQSVINYCLRTREHVILNNALEDSFFSSDSYIIEAKAQSVMCMPIVHNDNVIGAIYLENNIATNVFKYSKLDILSLISSQAAIALENAEMFERIKRLNDNLEDKVKERTLEIRNAIEYDKLKTEFFANISHELRTPLNLVLTANQMTGLMTEKIEDEKLREKLHGYNKLIRQNCYRLIRLTNNLIDITKIDAGFTSLYFQNLDIIKVVEDITQSVVEYAKRKNIKLIFDTEVEERIMNCNPDAIERIMLNLLSNSIKFTQSNGNITVIICDKKDEVSIHVKDTGAGIPIDKQESIFKRFVQVDKSLSRKCEGSGIGLSLVKSLVKMHEGTINVNSVLGKGSEFVITLPVKITDNDENQDNYRITALTQSRVERTHIEFSDIYFE